MLPCITETNQNCLNPEFNWKNCTQNQVYYCGYYCTQNSTVTYPDSVVWGALSQCLSQQAP